MYCNELTPARANYILLKEFAAQLGDQPMAKINRTLPASLPITDTIPNAGRLFYGAGKEKSYRLAKAGAIVTLDTGARSKVALMHATARKLGIDPND
jgi:hypothetical protein